MTHTSAWPQQWLLKRPTTTTRWPASCPRHTWTNVQPLRSKLRPMASKPGYSTRQTRWWDMWGSTPTSLKISSCAYQKAKTLPHLRCTLINDVSTPLPAQSLNMLSGRDTAIGIAPIGSLAARLRRRWNWGDPAGRVVAIR